LNIDPVLVVLTAAAVVIFWRLKSVLGQRTGLERPPYNSETPPKQSAQIIDLKATRLPDEPIWKGFAEAGSNLAQGLEQIAAAEKDFNPAHFIVGAKAAYEQIHTSFAKGDKPGLKPLLSKTVLENFSAAIDELKSRQETKIFQFVGLSNTKLVSASLIGKLAHVEVMFNSEMIMATLDKSGATLTGDAKAITEMTETWTFEKDVTSKDPNWKLSATTDAAD
jgi:predicted lipid-binding transport protein (Tim44 family)